MMISKVWGFGHSRWLGAEPIDPCIRNEAISSRATQLESLSSSTSVRLPTDRNANALQETVARGPHHRCDASWPVHCGGPLR